MTTNKSDVKSSGQEGDLQNIEEMRFNSIPCGVDEKGCEIFFHVKSGEFVTVAKQKLQNGATQEQGKSINILVSSTKEAVKRAKTLFLADNELKCVIAEGDCTCGGVLIEGIMGKLVINRGRGDLLR
jgi:hypothetical protein